MDFRQYKRAQRRFASSYAASIFVETNSTPPFSVGSGIFIEFRGRRLLLTCYHVVAPSADDTVYVVAGRDGFQNGKIHKRLHVDSAIDLAVLELHPEFRPFGKMFYPAGEALLEVPEAGTRATLHGTPTGRRDLQTGFTVDYGAQRVTLTTATYLTVVEPPEANPNLGASTPTLRWEQHEIMHPRTFATGIASASNPIDPRGFSGGPVFVGSENRLSGYASHVRRNLDGGMFYVPIAWALRRAEAWGL